MRTLIQSRLIELRYSLSGWLGRLKYAKTRARLSFFLALNVVVVLAVLPFLGVVTDQPGRASVRPKEDIAPWPTTTATALSEKALFLPSKLMRTATSNTGAPVLRFVE